ncbi:MAG TPA: hypothetical protein VD978_14465 [Azospirillum sp.]|nr:hypothetical protein [Azospirillum sp.]
MQKTIALATLCALLSGCLLPDRFDATLTLGADSATLNYRGELVAVSAYADATSGKLSAVEDEKVTREALDAVASDVRKDEGTMEAAFLGKGRATASVHWTQPNPAVGAKTSFADLVAIRRQGDGALEVVTPALKDRDRAQLTRMGLGGASGRLCIKTTGSVVESNAQATPAEPGGCHGWTIEVLKDQPVRMLVRF